MAENRELSLCRIRIKLKINKVIKLTLSLPNKGGVGGAQAVVYTDSAFFHFGGFVKSVSSSVVARLDARTYEWSQVGSLNTGRSYLNAILLNNYFLVIGGETTVEVEGDPGNYTTLFNLKTEKCHMSSGSMICSEQSPTLDNYRLWPELIAVEDSYCRALP